MLFETTITISYFLISKYTKAAKGFQNQQQKNQLLYLFHLGFSIQTKAAGHSYDSETPLNPGSRKE
jgi:hypothetical protein